MFVRNAWYVAAWDHEITRQMLRRIILEEPVVLFRTSEGKAVMPLPHEASTLLAWINIAGVAAGIALVAYDLKARGHA